jgi:hypothetical protein
VYLIETDHLPAKVIKLLCYLIKRMAADKKMVSLNIKRTVCKDVVLVRGKNMLNNSGGFAYSSLPNNN